MADNPLMIIKADDQAQHAFRFRHPLGCGNSEVIMTLLGRPAGLKRVGVNLGRVPPGKEGFVYHRHNAEEEWVYILDGEGVCDIDDKKTNVGKGDFIAFPAGVAHNILNTGASDLVYIMGGEQVSVEVADFPRHDKRMVRAGERSELVDAADCDAFYPDVEPIKRA